MICKIKDDGKLHIYPENKLEQLALKQAETDKLETVFDHETVIKPLDQATSLAEQSRLMAEANLGRAQSTFSDFFSGLYPPNLYRV